MNLPRPALPPGEHLVTFEQLRELNGFPMPVRPYVRKLRPLSEPNYPGWLRDTTIISGLVYPWVVADRNNEKWDLWAYQTWEGAYTKACEMVAMMPATRAFSPGRQTTAERNLAYWADLIMSGRAYGRSCVHPWSYHVEQGCAHPACNCTRSVRTIVGENCCDNGVRAEPRV